MVDLFIIIKNTFIVRDNEGVTPLHVAAVWNRPTIVRILLSYGGDPMIKDDAERNAFHYAYEEHAWETLKTLEIHRRTEMKKIEDRSDKTYSVELGMYLSLIDYELHTDTGVLSSAVFR